jgi:anti-sigma factor RsiW
MIACDDVRESLAALSLDALDVDERDVLEDHLARCPACADELRGYEETAALLALALPQREPPPALGARIAAAARATTDPAAGAGPPLGFVERASARPARARRPSLLALVAALALVTAIGSALWAAGLQRQLAEQQAAAASLEERAQRYDRVVAVLQADQIQVRPLEGTNAAPGAFGRVYVDPASGAGMMMVRSLPPLPEGRAYQLWLVKADGQRASCGLIRRTDPAGNGYALIQAPGSLTEWQGLGVTDEPAGGSPAPTGTRVLAGAI